MIKFIKGYNYKNGERINEWEVNGELIKIGYEGANAILLEGAIQNETLEEIQNIVDQSVEDAENGKR